MTELSRGLAGIEVDTTSICLVDGDAGELYYRDEPVGDLVDGSFADVAYLVLRGDRPADSTFAAALVAGGELSERDRTLITEAARTQAHPMQVVQGLVPLLEEGEHFDVFGEASHGLTIAAKLPGVMGRLLRERGHGDWAPPASGVAARAWEVTQILQIEHGFNASTFACRVIASTLAPVQNCVSGALGALHGPLHGGADQAALEMALHVGGADRAAAYVDECLKNGTKIMGMGHREYRVLDPRARFVKAFARELAEGTELQTVFETLEAIEARFRERMLERGKSLHANLEFYKGVVYRAVGLPSDYFTVAFALARVFGYVAHFMESREDNKLIRPAARYIGQVQPVAA